MRLRVFVLGASDWRELTAALRFLTRLPVPGPRADRGPGEAAGAFPLAGLLLGLALAVLDGILGGMGLPPVTRDALLIAALVWLTGGLHLDGLMRICDGLLGGRTPEERLAVARARRVGSFGVLAGVCVLLVKVGLLGAFHGGGRLAALLVAPMLGRWSLVLAVVLFPPDHAEGVGAAFQTGISPRRLIRAASTCLLVSAAVGAPALAAFALCSGAVWALGRAIARRFGDLTGDGYGAICEASEVLALLVLAASAHHPG